MLRTPMERIVGSELSEFLGLPDRSRLNALLEDAWIGSSRGEASALTPDGNVVPLRLGLRRLQLGPEAFIAVVATDLTEVRRHEEELRQSQQRLQIAVAAANLGAWEIDLTSPDRNLRLAEPYVAMLGRDADELPRNEKELFACIHPGDRDLLRRNIAIAVAGDAVVQCEFRILWPDGSIHWHATLGRTTRDAWGRPLRLAGVGMDVTQRHETEAELRQSQKLEAVSHLAGGLALDFNNISAAILLQVELLEMRTDLADEVRLALHDLGGLAVRASDLTRQLLMFGRRSVLSRRPLDLNETLAAWLRRQESRLDPGIEVCVDLEPDLPPVEADAGLLEHVMAQLLGNALDAMPTGGRITFQTTLVHFDIIHLARNRNRRPGPHLCLAVRDAGCGIDPELLPRVFEPFFGTKPLGRSHGLGLATVHGIVAQHHGWVEVESVLGAGTTLRIYLPADERRPVGTPISTPPAPRRGDAPGILVVEDEPELLRLVGQALEILGYRAYQAATGPEALALWQNHQPKIDLLLSDTVLPGGMSGLQLAEKLRETKPELKVIMTSGYSPEINTSPTIGRAAFAYLPKPYEIRTLAGMIRGCLAK